MVSVPDFITAVEVVPGEKPLPFAKGKLPSLQEVGYEEQMPVRWHDIDLNRHVTNTRYLQWVLETLPADVLEKQQLQEIDIIFKAESALGDTVLATAGPAEEPGAFLHKLISAETGKELVQSKTKFVS
jgi:medium-chain acyl-[acyl-carrier-protein] hydrolase